MSRATMTSSLVALATIGLVVVQETKAFSVTSPRTNSRKATVQLFAKTANKKKKKPSKPISASSNSGGGGFGKATSGSAAANLDETLSDEYAVFPPLERQVMDTLIPSPPELQEAGALPGEVYDRLDKIYGFPHFNYQSRLDDDDGAGIPLNEMISASPTLSSASASRSTRTSSMSGLDFANLLATATATATGDDRVAMVEDNSPNSDNDSNMHAISNLPQFSEFRVLHVDPLVLAIDDFFTGEECDRYVAMAESPSLKGADDDTSPYQTRSKTVGKDLQSKAQRTSTTWFHHYKNVPELMSKASRLLGLDGIDQWEEAQTVRYRRNEKFTWHLDALAPGAESSPNLGGQRTATLLVYLTDLAVSDGGATIFRDLSSSTAESENTNELGDNSSMLRVQPKKGSALLFFPAAGGIPNTPFDIRTLHCGEAVDDAAMQDKWISQLWLRESSYTPSAPPGNLHELARGAIADYCSKDG